MSPNPPSVARDNHRDWRALGERLREAREFLGLSQQEVAELLSVSRPAVSQMEAGKRKVSSLEAGVRPALPSSLRLAGRRAEPGRGGRRRRHQSAVSHHPRAVRPRSRAGAALRGVSQRRRWAATRPRGPVLMNRDEIAMHRRTGSLRAQRALKTAGVDFEAPIDVFDAIERERVWLIFQPLDRLYGAYRRHATPGIVVNSGHPTRLQRFTAAHEPATICSVTTSASTPKTKSNVPAPLCPPRRYRRRPSRRPS